MSHPACSASLELAAATAGSRSTLLSEVVGGGVSLRRLLPPGRTRHTRLRDSERGADSVQQRLVVFGGFGGFGVSELSRDIIDYDVTIRY